MHIRTRSISISLLLAGLFLLVLAARWMIVDGYSSQVPFWDQWLFEAPLLRAAALGEVPWLSLANSANEHRILWTRLLQISTFWGNTGQWDAQVLLTINAFLAAAVPVAAVLALVQSTGRGIVLALGALAAALWLCPVQWYNTLWAIQSIVYLLALFSLGGMALVLRARENSAGWWAGVAMLVAGLFSMGSGLLAPAAVVGVCGLRAWRGKNVKAAGWTAGAAFAVLVLGVALQSGTGRVDGLYATSLGEFLGALYKSLCWPWTLSWEAGSAFPLGILLWLPAPIFLVLVVLRRKREGLEPGSWEVLAAVILWIYAQLVIMAFTRGSDGRPPSWRHYDVHVIGVLANAAALAVLLRPWLQAEVQGRFRYAATAGVGLFAALLASGMVHLSKLALTELEFRKGHNRAQIENLRAFLATDDAAAHLENKPPFHVPWDDPAYLATVLRDPVIREMLPPALREPVNMEFVRLGKQSEARLRFEKNMLPPFLPPPPHRDVFTSWKDEPLGYPIRGLVMHERFRLAGERLPYLIIPYTGEFAASDPEAHIALGIFSSQFHRPKFADPGQRPNRTWGEAIAPNRSPGQSLEMIAAIQGSHLDEVPKTELSREWLAVMEPLGAGRLTIWTRAWRRGAGFLIGAGVFLVAVGLLLLTRELLQRPKPEHAA